MKIRIQKVKESLPIINKIFVLIIIINNLSIDEEIIQTKLDEKFIFSEAKPLNKNIWKNVKTASNKSSRNRIIKLQEISEEERTECRRLIDYGINLVATHFDRKISFSSINKTGIGYYIKLLCTKRKCSSYWSIRINIINNQVNEKCKSLCEHLLSDEPSNIFFCLNFEIF